MGAYVDIWPKVYVCGCGAAGVERVTYARRRSQSEIFQLGYRAPPSPAGRPARVSRALTGFFEEPPLIIITTSLRTHHATPGQRRGLGAFSEKI
jgi:hypothetical protein